MTEEELAAIEASVAEARHTLVSDDWNLRVALEDRRALLAEVRRLREVNTRLQEWLRDAQDARDAAEQASRWDGTASRLVDGGPGYGEPSP